MNNSEKCLVTRIPLTQLKKLLKLHRKKSNNWSMVCFIHNGSEITNWMGHSFKTKSTKSKATFSKDNNIFFEFQVADHQISTSTLELYSNSLKQLFLQLHLWKNIFSSSFYQRILFCQFVDKKVMGLGPNYYLLAGDTSQVSIFFLT